MIAGVSVQSILTYHFKVNMLSSLLDQCTWNLDSRKFSEGTSELFTMCDYVTG